MKTSKGGRPATGWVKWRRGQWYVMLTLGNGERPWVALDPNIPHEDVVGAKACAKLVSDEARAVGAVPKSTKETVGQWFGRFHDHKEARGLSSVDDMRGYFRN
jgi:hypothetical protein